MIEVDRLTVTFPARGVHALRGVSLTVGAGERVALVGPSGSGKTTLLRALLAAVPAAGGSVRVGGVDPAAVRADARRVRRMTGTIRQGDDLVRGLTARVNIAVGALAGWRLRDWPRLLAGRAPASLEGRIVELAVRHGIADCLDARVESLSGGQRQRVAVCRALVGRPALLLADEPTTGLDPVTSAVVLDALDEDRAVTALLATHDPEVIARCDRMIALKDGLLVHDGRVLGNADLAPIYGDGSIQGEPRRDGSGVRP